MIKDIDGKPVIIKGKLVAKFLQPVFYNEKHDIYYYISQEGAGELLKCLVFSTQNAFSYGFFLSILITFFF